MNEKNTTKADLLTLSAELKRIEKEAHELDERLRTLAASMNTSSLANVNLNERSISRLIRYLTT